MIRLSDIKYRVSRANERGAQCLVYIDARTAFDELDEKYGVGNWRFTYGKVEGEMWAIHGYLEVRLDKEWIMHEDVGYPNDFKTTRKPSETQWMKDAVSDAVKRCAVQVGIGRFLYDAPFLFTREVEAHGKKWILTKMGKKEIQGRINDWYKKIQQ